MPLLCSCDWLDRTMVKLEVGMEVGVAAREEVGVAAREEADLLLAMPPPLLPPPFK